MDSSLAKSMTQLTMFDHALMIHFDIERLGEMKKVFSEGFREVMRMYKELPANIFACYEFIDSDEKGVFNIEGTKGTCFVKVLRILKEGKFGDLNGLVGMVEECLMKEGECSDEEKYATLLMLLYVFLQENAWGPSHTFILETEKVDHSEEIGKFNNNYFNTFALSKEISNEMLNSLSASGEEIYKHAKILPFYYIPYHFIIFKQSFKGKWIIEPLWQIRLLTILSKMIREPVDSIQKSLTNLYETGFIIDKIAFEDNKIKGLLQIEKSFYHMKYFQYKHCTNIIEIAKDNLGVDITLTGKMGRKTKFQDFDTPVLVVSVDSNKDQAKNDNNDTTSTITNDSLGKLTLADDNPLLEKPRLTNEEEEKHFSSQVITIYDQIYIISLLNYLRRGLPDEDLKREIILSYSEKALKISYDWLVYSKLLFHRSIAEHKITKKIERALMQIESLCNQFNDRSPIPYERLKMFWIVDYPMIFDLKKQYAELYMSFGAVKTACDIFKELHMHEETIQCLYVANNRTDAKDLAMKVLAEGPDPGIYCILGELENNVDYFHKAIEVSKRSYPRAFRCLGRYYYCQKDEAKAMEYYEKAMAINPIYPDIWFNMGCLYLKAKQMEKAASCFSRILIIDDSSTEVWGNLGVCFIQLKKYKEAMKCFDEGFSRSRKNWKLLDNLIFVSVECQDIHKLVYGIENMFLLDQVEAIRPGYYYHLVKIFITNMKTYTDHDIKFLTRKINSIFDSYMMKDGQKPEVWDIYAVFIEGTKGKNAESAKEMIEIILKEIRGMILHPLWDKDEIKRKRLEMVIGKGMELLKSVQEAKDMVDYVKDKTLFFNDLLKKCDIERSKEDKPQENK